MFKELIILIKTIYFEMHDLELQEKLYKHRIKMVRFYRKNDK